MYCHHFRTCSYVNLLSLPTLPTHARVKDGAPSFNGVAVYKYEYLAIEWSVNIFAISSNVLAINEFVLGKTLSSIGKTNPTHRIDRASYSTIWTILVASSAMATKNGASYFFKCTTSSSNLKMPSSTFEY